MATAGLIKIKLAVRVLGSVVVQTSGHVCAVTPGCGNNVYHSLYSNTSLRQSQKNRHSAYVKDQLPDLEQTVGNYASFMHVDSAMTFQLGDTRTRSAIFRAMRRLISRRRVSFCFIKAKMSSPCSGVMS